MSEGPREDSSQVRREVIAPGSLPRPTSPISPAIRFGNLVFVSGQTAPEAVGVEAQTRAVLEKIGTVLRESGSDLAHVLRCNVYLLDIGSFDQMNEVYAEVFVSEQPARTTIECKMARPTILVEIDCIAGTALHS